VRSTAFALALCLSAGTAQAQLLSNFGPGPYQLGTSLGLDQFGVDRSKAVGLTIGSSAFDFINMRVVLGVDAPGPGGTVTGGIFSSTGGNPGTLLSAFSSVVLPNTVADAAYTFTTLTPFTLAANTTYWFLLDGPSTANLTAWRSLTPAPTAGTGATFAGYRFSSNGGTTWAASTINNVVEINARPTVVIPEPSTYALMATGLIGLALVQRRRRA
jgi:hypothetical protein